MSGSLQTGELLTGTADVVQQTVQTLVDHPRDFFTSSTGGYIFGSIVILLYITFLIWTIKDSSMRYKNVFGPIACTLMVALLTPLLGIPLYLALRPSIYKYDTLHWREALDLQTIKCFACSITNRIESAHCIFCGKGLQHTCTKCHKPHPYDHPHCPHCGNKNKTL